MNGLLETITEEAQEQLKELGFPTKIDQIEILSEEKFKQRKRALEYDKRDMSMTGKEITANYEKIRLYNQFANVVTLAFYTREFNGEKHNEVIVAKKGVENERVSSRDRETLVKTLTHELAHVWSAQNAPIDIASRKEEEKLAELEFKYSGLQYILEEEGLKKELIKNLFMTDIHLPTRLYRCVRDDENECIDLNFMYLLFSDFERSPLGAENKAATFVREGLMSEEEYRTLYGRDLRTTEELEKTYVRLGNAWKAFTKITRDHQEILKELVLSKNQMEWFREGFATYVERLREPKREEYKTTNRRTTPRQRAIMREILAPSEKGARFFEAIGKPSEVRRVMIEAQTLEEFYGLFINHKEDPVYSPETGFLGLKRHKQQKEARAWLSSR